MVGLGGCAREFAIRINRSIPFAQFPLMCRQCREVGYGILAGLLSRGSFARSTRVLPRDVETMISPTTLEI